MSRARAYVTSAEIARDIVETRSRLSRSLAVLDREYALRNLFVHAVRVVGEGKSAPAIADAVKRNAVPLSLVGIGLAWMAFARRGDAPRELWEALGQLWRSIETAVGRSPALGPTNKGKMT